MRCDAKPTRALVRGVADSYVQALSSHPQAGSIDVELARRQHRAYVEALRASGLEVIELDVDERYPDGCFVEDQAVVLGGRALVTRSGATSRRGEANAVAAALAPHVALEHMDEPATLDGGDVLVLRHRCLVGRSARTNRTGVEVLHRFAEAGGRDVIERSMPKGLLHFKSACSALSPDVVVAAEGLLSADAFPRDVEVIWVPVDEAYAANVVGIGRYALMAAGYPRAAERIEAAGFDPVPLDNSEFQKGDGALTCLSVLFAPAR